MIPLIIIGSNEAVQAYCDDYIATHKIPSYALHTIEKEKAHLGIGEVRLINQLLVQHRGVGQCVIVPDFDTATTEAQNAFLKTLEEIDLLHHVLLCCTSADTIVSTIVSRCKKIFLPAGDEQNTEIQISDTWLTQTTTNHKEGLPLAQSVIYTIAQSLRKDPSIKAAKTAHALLEIYSTMKLNNVNAELSLDEMFFLLEEK